MGDASPHQSISTMFLMNTVFPKFRTSSITITLCFKLAYIENVHTGYIMLVFGEEFRIRGKKFK